MRSRISLYRQERARHRSVRLAPGAPGHSFGEGIFKMVYALNNNVGGFTRRFVEFPCPEETQKVGNDYCVFIHQMLVHLP